MIDRLPLNFELLRAPENWVIVTLMVAFGGLALAMIFPTSGASKAPEQTGA
jgi:hypothetical protein